MWEGKGERGGEKGKAEKGKGERKGKGGVVKSDGNGLEMGEEIDRARAKELRKQILDRRLGEAVKRSRAKDPSLGSIRKRTEQLVTSPRVLTRPEHELRKPTDAELLSAEERICISLLTTGYVDSFSEFFKITHPKCPGSYHYDFYRDRNGESGGGSAPPIVPVEKYDFLKTRLVEAEIARRSSRDADLARAYTELSQYFQSINDMRIAIIYLEKLRDYALFTSDLVREAQALKEIGRLFKEAGNLESSLRFCEECLSVCVSINDGVSEAQTALIEAYRSYSASLIQRGDGQHAIEYLEKSLKVASDSGVLLSLAICHHELGLCYKQMEELDAAIDHFEQSYQIYRGLKHVEGQSTAVSSLATSYKYVGNIDKAIEYFKILHELANQTGNAEDKALSCLTMGKILWESGDKEEALKWFQRNFDISLELDDLSVIEDSRISLGASLANYRMSMFETLLRRKDGRGLLLDWKIRRDDGPFSRRR